MSAKHTSGPWKAHHLASYTEPGWVILFPDTSKPGIHHRRLDSKGNFIEEDARLIAAAPELLEALQQMLYWSESRLPCGDPSLQELVRAQAAARAAIAKATGAT